IFFACVPWQGRLGCRAQRFTLLKKSAPPALPSMHLNGAQGAWDFRALRPFARHGAGRLTHHSEAAVASRKGIHRCCRNGIGVLDILCF
ncbi:hypothetical protein, partial [Stutzerimonas stutzeri]|uniref:hypothetical protein n=1 Tax=Stutzerimonas stutzeri TaxID=316 RepID=UPI002108A684